MNRKISRLEAAFSAEFILIDVPASREKYLK
jgi:hypothetical protein